MLANSTFMLIWYAFVLLFLNARSKRTFLLTLYQFEAFITDNLERVTRRSCLQAQASACFDFNWDMVVIISRIVL